MNNNLYEKIEKDNCYYFRDNKNNKEIKFLKKELHDCEIYSCDILRISKDFDYEFIDFILKELIKTKDLLVVEVLFQNEEIIDILHKNNLKIANINYEIPLKKYNFQNEFVVSNKLDSESKKYFLNHINEIGRINQKYMNPNVKYREVSDKWFGIEDYQFLIYKYNGKIMGMVDFKIFDDDKCADDLYNCCNSICIRTILADNEKIIEDMFKDLINRYQKRIILSHLYTDIMLKNAILNVNGIFKYLFVINRNLKD